ncbi:arylamine N-acetyltransferase [Mycolicibacterium austroafricanum]|uniref:Arylamine N-acetyltransferase n=1 Tax=Mycolicibacterium austroafricanum TaxID=39687 RepID=A0ABT8H764_MYCAO|nr:MULTISPECIES: arylamine N-acetyltransferase [Mycolicibacterium]MDN4516601.1 arylamine N-acetyltransferase [Mycolicibacterium austroafricanum]MDW5610212.1 arylamine N-acetyltransferase [Mycolicibacterium sp. D5.8-2]QRZ10000.1 arylamine N-acetyltransferase [Mycolicibacterium austroafricanum]QZT71138.1 arylamine N-acetyltransferase [Mycolicibacterium austroafricanum]
MSTLLDAYFTRIGLTMPVESTLDALRDIVAGHNRSIPFENLDPVTGIPVVDLSAEALADKLLGRRRGGYCYEQNGLLGYVLDDLGFGVQRLVGRVIWMQDDDTLPAQTHQVLSVTLPDGDGPYLVDVGFGGQTLSSPIRLAPGQVQQTRHEPYRLLDHPEGFELQARVGGVWESLYLLDPIPRPRIDLEVGSWYVSTYPESVFVRGLTAALVTDDARWNLRGRRLAVHRAGGSEKTRLGSAADVLEVLEGRFGINLADLGDRAELEARVGRVLDS